MKTDNNLGSIRVEASSDAGCDWSAEDQKSFCEHVVQTLGGAYPEVTVECEILDRFDTLVFVYGKENRNGLVTHPEIEDELIHTIKGIVQDVWERGDFWVSQKEEEEGAEENAENQKYMQERIRDLSRDVLDKLMMAIVETLYPSGDLDHEWSPDTLQSLCETLASREIQPWAKGDL